MAETTTQFKEEDGKYTLSGDELISDVIDRFPKAAGVLMSYGLNCVGCAASSFDTIRDGAKLHGMPEDRIDQMVADVNKTINKKIETLEVTPEAVAKIKELREKEEGKEGWPLRVAVVPGGCAGFSYEMDYDEKKPGDEVFVFDDLEIVVDSESYPMLKGSSIDYVDSLMGAGFKIDNPNSAKGCGCGKSFG